MIDYAVSTGKAAFEQAQGQFNFKLCEMLAPIFGLVIRAITSLIIATFVRTKNS